MDIDAQGTARVTEPAVCYFHSSIRDDAVIVLFEAVLVMHSAAQPQPWQTSVGWAALNLLSPSRAVPAVDDDTGESVDVGLNFGSPLAVMFPPAAAAPSSGKPAVPAVASVLIPGAKLLFRFHTHEALRAAAHLISENEVIGPLTIVPGLAPARLELSRLLSSGPSTRAGRR